MRLSKVASDKSQTYVAKAVAGGMMQSNDDNAKLLRSSEHINPIGSEISGNEKANFYATKLFVEHLRTTTDPRMGTWLHSYPGALTATAQTTAIGTKDPDVANGFESWSNFRRTGYPQLQPNPYPASEIPGEFIRRHIYPNREQEANIENLDAAIARHSAANCKMNGRVWWDKL